MPRIVVQMNWGVGYILLCVQIIRSHNNDGDGNLLNFTVENYSFCCCCNEYVLSIAVAVAMV